MKTILITGGLGFIGRHIAATLLRAGHNVIIFDIAMPESNLFDKEFSGCSGSGPGSLININVDTRNKALLEYALRISKPDTVIHLAAMADPNLALKMPAECWEINVTGLRNLLCSLKAVSGVEKIVFASSSYVYGDFAYEPVDEIHSLEPRHIYGLTKLEGEKLLCRMCGENNIKYTIIRPTSVYGEGSGLHRVCLKMIHSALIKKEIIIHDGGTDRLDFTHISDLVGGILRILDNSNSDNQIFNISRGEARSLSELAGIIKAHIPRSKIINSPADFRRPKRGALDISKARALLGYEPKVNLEEGIAELITKLSNKINNNDDIFVPSVH